jgi:6-phosphogluconate dehydrogenase
MSDLCDFGLIGLAVMGENLALNVESRGYRVAVFNRTTEKVDALMATRAKGKNFVGCHSIPEMVKNLKRPRVVMMLVKAGPAVDDLIDQLTPHLEPGDILIDGGNTHYVDTERRTKQVESKGLLFVGSGVSGGEEGALKGPSLMPGGSKAAWPAIKPIFQAISAKVGPNNDIPCCEWVGPRGAGHYVKMVHNGIEYGDMQLICEAYLLLKEAAGLSNEELYDVFEDWNRGELQSYLIEISRDIFSVRDDQGGKGYLVDQILDVAGAKGTGKWMSQLALDLGVPSTLVTTAVYARCLAAMKEARVRASKVLSAPVPSHNPAFDAAVKELVSDRKKFIEAVRQALYASKICSYAQGFVQLQEASKELDWGLNYGDCALLWRGGCIIRAQFLDRDLDIGRNRGARARGAHVEPARIGVDRRVLGARRDRLKRRPLRREVAVRLDQQVDRRQKLGREDAQQISEGTVAKALLQRSDLEPRALEVVVLERFRRLREIDVGTRARGEELGVVEVRAYVAAHARDEVGPLARGNLEQPIDLRLQGDDLRPRGGDETEVGVIDERPAGVEDVLRTTRIDRAAVEKFGDGGDVLFRSDDGQHRRGERSIGSSARGDRHLHAEKFAKRLRIRPNRRILDEDGRASSGRAQRREIGRSRRVSIAQRDRALVGERIGTREFGAKFARTHEPPCHVIARDAGCEICGPVVRRSQRDAAEVLLLELLELRAETVVLHRSAHVVRLGRRRDGTGSRLLGCRRGRAAEQSGQAETRDAYEDRYERPWQRQGVSIGRRRRRLQRKRR